MLFEPFRFCIGTKIPRRRLVDEELVLRFFALRETLSTYKPPLKRVLNEFMDQHRDPHARWLAQRTGVFEKTMTRLSKVPGSQSFRLIDKDGDPLRDEDNKPLPRGVNRALFDAQSIAFSWVDGDISPRIHSRIIEAISDRLAEDGTQDAVRRATGDRRRIFSRVRAMVAALESAKVDLYVPGYIRTV